MTDFSKIQKFVESNGIQPSQCLYHTQRSVKNKKGEVTGKIRVLATNDSKARAEYVCPECSSYGYQETEWKKPFSVKCEKCGAKISVPKMKAEAKRDLKGKD